MNELKGKKVLFTSHTANFSKFNRPFMRWFKEQGYEVHYASAGEEEVKDCDRHFSICFNRSPYSLDNFTAYRQLKRIIDRENYDIIHCHTPMGSVVTRLAARGARKKGTKVIYTAHGFHFYSGAPFINWVLYYPIEKCLSKYIDCLITINKEDYLRANKKFHTKNIYKIDSVGVDLSRFASISNRQKQNLRSKYGYGLDEPILICVGEFTTNKDQAFMINILPELIKKIPNLKLVFAGVGYRMEPCQRLVNDLGVQKHVDFLGYRQDVDKLYQLSDILVSFSRREGLPINILEGMATGLPVVCTSVRGHVDVIKHGLNGFLYDCSDQGAFIKNVLRLFSDKKLIKSIKGHNLEDVKKYSVDNAIKTMKKIYKK